MPPSGARFTYRGARSGAFTAGLALAIAVEAVALHLWLVADHPGWAWALTALSALTLVHLALEWRAWGADALVVTGDALHLRVRGRGAATIPRTVIAAATAATWRDVPDDPNAAYLNGTSPAEPNVVLRFAEPTVVCVAGGLVRRRVERLGLHVDDPAAFVRALEAVTALVD